MNPFGSRPGVARRSAWAGLVALLVSTSVVRAAEEKDRLDCGVNSLYLLLRLEGRSPSFDELLGTLPTTHPDGLSMAELMDASGLFGLKLDGVQFPKGGGVLDRPMIAFFQGPKNGHFAVIRPVGTTRKMVQVIDPPNPPWIGDLDRLPSNKAWTGRVLIPRKPWISDEPARWAIGSAVLAAILFGCRRAWRGPRARALA